MKSLASQKELRGARDPGFCYVCGRTWTEADETNRDHVPPAKLFAPSDLEKGPLVLRTHVTCNNGYSRYDEHVAQLVSLLWKVEPGPEDVSSLRVSLHEPEGKAPFGAVEGLELQSIIARWLRGFHAALYGEFLPRGGGYIFPPLPGADLVGQDTMLHVSHPVLVREVRKNRIARTIDSVVSCGGACRYECVWSHLDSGRPICIFALDLYAWERLGDVNNFPARSCVGWYEVPGRIPPGASLATRLEFPVDNREPLRAFD